MKILLTLVFAIIFSASANAQEETVVSTQTATTPAEQITPNEKKDDARSKLLKQKKSIKKTALSGLVLMPTAYRGTGLNEIGPGLDINAAYYIGRLYGKNDYMWTNEKKNYLDRLGIWIFSADTKLQVQTEGKYRPAMAAGAQGIFTFRDSKQPDLNTNYQVQQKVNSSSNNSYANAYIALSKRLGNKIIINAGYSHGDMPKMINSLSEFLSKESKMNNGYANAKNASGMLFGGIMWLPKPNSPISVEYMIPQGAQMSPKLINLHLGTLLKLNFEISYLKFDGGWDLLGMFQFRYNYWPR